MHVLCPCWHAYTCDLRDRRPHARSHLSTLSVTRMCMCHVCARVHTHTHTHTHKHTHTTHDANHNLSLFLHKETNALSETLKLQLCSQQTTNLPETLSCQANIIMMFGRRGQAGRVKECKQEARATATKEAADTCKDNPFSAHTHACTHTHTHTRITHIHTHISGHDANHNLAHMHMQGHAQRFLSW